MNEVYDSRKKINQTPYLVFSILATVFCCIPLGIPAIVFAAKISSLQASGDWDGAQESAKKAKTFTIIAAVVGVVVVIAYFALVFFGVVASLGSSGYGYYH